MNNNVNLSSLLSATIEEVQDNRQVILIYLAAMVLFTGGVYAVAGGAALNLFDLNSLADQSYAALGTMALIGGLIGFAVYIVASYYLIAGMVHRTTAPSFDALLPFAGIWLLSVIGIGVGLMLLIIPGIYLIVRWVALLPVVVGREGPSLEAFSTSSAMSDGHGWSIFGAYVILYIMVLVISIVGAGFGAIGGPIVVSIFDIIVTAVSGVLYTALSVGAYRIMRDDNEELAQVFE